MSVILWFRQDLRLEDNPALAEAVKSGLAIQPVYIWSPEEEGAWAPGSASRWWMHHALDSLEADLRKLGLNLLYRYGPYKEAFIKLQHETRANTILFNRRYEPAAIKRDAELKSYFKDKGIQFKSFNGNLLFEPWTILNKQKKPFQVFTPFWEHCQTLPAPSKPLPAPTAAKGFKNLRGALLKDFELLPKTSWDEGLNRLWKPGEKEAHKVLKAFTNNPIKKYADQRDFPGVHGTSHLSPYLHFGVISPRTIWHASNNEIFTRQLGWREFAHHLLYHFPETPEKPLKPDWNRFPWSSSKTHLEAWKKGLTGYPIVDAGMRELWMTGYMHNRARMIAGSFLVKDLLLPWQEGAKWFWDTLVDADLANNTLGWQWVSGCGADAAPYFRIFNPILQGEKFDPEGEYVKKWVPELKKVPLEFLHKPWEAPSAILKQAGVVLGSTYPHPIVDHAQAREKALEAFASLKLEKEE
jgi:deoxyribodipyrimidine photo-lyase